MPGTLWSAPVPNLGVTSLVTSSFTTATLTDISNQQIVLWPGMLNQGTRIRLRAFGNVIASTTASTVTWGFYMNSTATNNIATTPAALAAASAWTAINTAAAAWPWQMEWEGHVRALTSPLVGATNAQIMGQGRIYTPLTLTTWTSGAPLPIPLTAALRTVQQTATGLVTNIPQTVMVGVTIATNTGLTSITTDEFTCELLG